MEKHIEELRNLELDLEAMLARKEAIKKKALEHRDTPSPELQAEAERERSEIESEIKKLEQRKAELMAEAEKKEGEKRRMNETIINQEQRDEIVQNFVKTRKLDVSAKELRSVLLASDGVAKPTKVNGIGDPFNSQISVLDQVQVVDMTGAGAFKESYLKTHSVASEKEDGVAQTASDPTFGTVTITPTEIAVTTYVSKELEKVTPLNYLAKVQTSALIALKIKLAQDIVTKIKTSMDDKSAVMYQTLNASADNGMLASGKGAINDKTLRRIALSYGGDANVYGNAWLYLNKEDLIAFGDVRGTNEKKPVYEITPNESNPNIGIIKDGGLSVPYCIVPSLTKLSGTAQSSSAATQTMIYGSPLNFELALFGNYSIEVSKDYKFAEGLLTVLGSVTTGGNVIMQNGFVVVTLPKSGS